uniref:MaoC family dehydratase n=1 Tax=uncultured bacterium 50 TaxID=1748278 RepID=A0A0U3TS55_9BACT|nr:MaoC family dehydratase [uncultured bacterium 50]
MSTLKMATLTEKVGQELGTTRWVALDQSRIQAFADCTGDQQWIHTDVERAKKESPFGGPVAHGMLTLSLLPMWLFDLPAAPDDAGAILNYGFDKVRFLAPVKSGAKVRARIKLLAATPKEKGRVLLTQEYTVEIENETKPALIAELLVMLIPKAA